MTVIYFYTAVSSDVKILDFANCWLVFFICGINL